MTLEEFRQYCLSLEGTYEYYPFVKRDDYYNDAAVFYVGPKWFAMVNTELFDYCNLKCDSERIPALIDAYSGIRPGYHMNKKHWISVYFDDDVPDELLRELILRSYTLVKSKLTKKQLAELNPIEGFKKE